MSRPPAIIKRVSSGGIIFRMNNKETEVALVSVKKGKNRCLPKGMIDKDEDVQTAALREVREETGLTGEIMEKIGQISYWFYLKGGKTKVHKTVHFFLMKFIEGSTDDHDHEVEEARWFNIDDAIDKLTYKSERELMIKAKRIIEGVKKS